MHVDHPIEKFPALSDLYFKLTGKAAVDITHTGVEELLEAINEYEFSILPPEQRIV